MVTVRRVMGDSMLPTFRPGTIVVGACFVRPKVGHIVVAQHGGLEIIKRVAKIDTRRVYLLGDNAAHSTDSRTYGWLDRSVIKSVIIGSIKR